MRKILFVALSASVGCGAAAEPAGAVKAPAGSAAPVKVAAPAAETTAEAAVAPPQAPAAPSRKATLRFDLADQDFPAPLVDVMVSGQPTTMLVDTGATHQVVGSWVAEQIGGVTSTSALGLDHAGKTVQLSKLNNAKIVVSGWGAIDASDAVVVALPKALAKQGIGGVISPQALAAEGRAVVLDLRKSTMTEAPLDQALAALASEKGVALSGEVKRCGEGGGSLPFVRAEIGGIAVDAQLDTGATQTSARAGSPVGTALAKRAKGASSAVAASGTYTVMNAEATRVKVGALEADADVALVPKAGRDICPNDAQVGMDVLRRCVLVIGTSKLEGRCGQ